MEGSASVVSFESLSEEINSLKRLRKQHRDQFAREQRRRRAKGANGSRSGSDGSSSRTGPRARRAPRPVGTRDSRSMSGQFPPLLLEVAYDRDERSGRLRLNRTHELGTPVDVVSIDEWRQTDDLVEQIIESNAHFSVLRCASREVPFSSELTDAALRSLGRRGPGLLDLDIAGCHLISAVGVSALVAGCKTLMALNLSGCSQLFDAAVLAIAQHCNQLTSLAVSDCVNLTDTSLIAVSHGCGKLERLDVARCRHVSDAAVEAVLEHCGGLDRLVLSGCHAITGHAFVEQNIAGTALARIRGVRELYMADCRAMHRSAPHWCVGGSNGVSAHALVTAWGRSGAQRFVTRPRTAPPGALSSCLSQGRFDE